MLAPLKKLRQHLLTGVSYAIPFIACGGILIAAAIAFVPMTATGPDFSHAPILKLVFEIGVASFKLMLSVLAGYIAYSIAGRPGMVPGFIGGYFPGAVKAGFPGPLLAGLVARDIAAAAKKFPRPEYNRPSMSIRIRPMQS